MDDFQAQHKIENRNNIIWLQKADASYARQYADALESILKGRALVKSTLRDLIYYEGSRLPELPKRLQCIPNGERCAECGRTFPEEDGFGGVVVEEDKRICFKCYIKRA